MWSVKKQTRISSGRTGGPERSLCEERLHWCCCRCCCRQRRALMWSQLLRLRRRCKNVISCVTQKRTLTFQDSAIGSCRSYRACPAGAGSAGALEHWDTAQCWQSAAPSLARSLTPSWTLRCARPALQAPGGRIPPAVLERVVVYVGHAMDNDEPDLRTPKSTAPCRMRPSQTAWPKRSALPFAGGCFAGQGTLRLRLSHIQPQLAESAVASLHLLDAGLLSLTARPGPARVSRASPWAAARPCSPLQRARRPDARLQCPSAKTQVASSKGRLGAQAPPLSSIDSFLLSHPFSSLLAALALPLD